MSDLPNSWQELKLAETCQIMAGFGFPERLQGNTSGDLPFYKVGDISEAWKRGEAYLANANHYISEQEAREIRAKPLPKNTTVFAKIGAAIALNRRAILSQPSLVDNNVMGLHPASEALDHKFLFHFICTVKLDELSRATTVPSIRKSDIEQIAIPVPPRSEQRRIVAEIEKQFTRLEAGVAALRRVQANLKRYRAAVLKAACEGRLVPTEAELNKSGSGVPPLGLGKKRQDAASTFETGEALLARILTERRKNWQGRGQYKEPDSADTTHLPPLPEGSTWASPDQLAAFDDNSICAGPFGTIFKAHDFRPSGVPIIFLRHVVAGRYLTHKPGFMDERKWQELFRPYSVFGGELLVTKLGEPPGVCAIYPEGIGPAMVTPDVIKIAVNQAAVLPRFLMHYFNSENARRFSIRVAFGTTRLRLTIPIFRRMPVPLPPLAEQTRIVAEVERRLSVVEELEAVVSANLQRATRLRQSILKKAFTGEL